ncbi:Vomp family autotransporter [Bartonella mastomydis]|uniref:Vomp family autotransporter n=1 Tax=Bartonella mastomydis TaxID=1820002 RepID=UPI00111610E0|nr:Vomp family autotransporter [Bartonella mastomydis]
MKKKYSTPNLIKAVSLSAAMATLLSSVSPVFAANLAITGQSNLSTNLTDVVYPRGSHGSIVLAGDDNYCGADNVIGRGGKQQEAIGDNRRITAKEQYERFIDGKPFSGRKPYGTTTEKVTWTGEGTVSDSTNGYMGTNTGGIADAMPEAYGVYSFATGCGSAATGNYSTVFGAGATAKAGGAQAFGVSALAEGIASVAIGVDSEAKGDSAVAIGGLATALGKSSVALGTKVKAEKNYAIAIGVDAEALGSGSIAIGGRRSDRTEENDPNRKVVAEAENAIAIGTYAYAKMEDSVAIGVNAQVFFKDGVAIGGGSVSRRDKGAEAYDPATGTVSNKKNDLAWKSTAGAFSIGEVGAEGNDGKGKLTRQITGVAAGKEDTDAVNVAQLKALRGIIGEGGGGGWQISANNTAPTDVNAGDTVDFSVNNNKNAEGKDNLKITKSNEDNKHKIEFTLSDTLKLKSVTTGQSSMSDDGFFVDGDTNGSSMTVDGFYVNGYDTPSMTVEGIDAGNKRITNVADGARPNDAVNFGQLEKYVKENGGGWKLSVESGEATNVETGNTVHFFAATNNHTGNKNIKIANTNGKNVSFDLANDINVMSVTAGDSVMDAAGFRFNGGDGPSITVKGIHAGNKTIKGVAAGEGDTDAVNFGQLKKYVEKNGGSWKLSVEDEAATDVKAGSTVNLVAAEGNGGHKNIQIAKSDGNKVTFSLNNDLKLTSVTTGNSKISNEGFEFIDGGPSIKANGIDADNKKIINVKAGEHDTDAVNYKQLQDVQKIAENGWKLSVDGKNATDVKAGSTVDLVAGENEYGSQNVKIKKDNDNKVTFTLNDDLKLTSVTTGNSKISNEGFEFIDGGPSIKANGIDADNKKIINVKAGEHDTDAVNYSQLKDVKQLVIKGWKLSVDGNNATDVGAGSTVDLIAGATKSGGKNIQIEKGENNKVIFSLKDHIALSSVMTGNSIMSNDGFAFINGGPSITSRGIDAGSKKITNVLEGTDDTDAVNYKQLKEIKGQIAEDSLVKWNEDGKRITIGAEKEGVEINITNSKGQERVIDGVRAGKISHDSREAINGDQLLSITETIADFFGGEETDIYNGIKPTFTVYNKEYRNVTDAFAAVDTSITDIYNQINNVTENSLVKWDKSEKLITIGREKGGTKIDITGTDGVRTIAGVKKGELSENSTDAINGSQINQISGDIAEFFGGGTKFENGVFKKPRYNLTTIDKNGDVKGKEYNDVGSALSGLDTNIRQVNQHLIYAMNDVASYFGGGAGYDDKKEWHAPTFKVIQFKADGTSSKKNYSNVADAFDGVNNTFTNIHNQISDITENSLVKWDEDKQLITVGAKKGGMKIDITGTDGERIIAGVKDGDISEDSHDAINGSQIHSMGSDIAKFFGGGAKFVNGAFEGLKYTLSAIVDGTVGKANFYDVGSALTGLDKNVQDVNKRLTNVSNKFDQKIEGISKDALLWSEEDNAFVARHEKNGKKTNSKLKYLVDGEIADGSTDAITGNQLYFMSNKLANYFGGGAKYENGKWTDPTFKIVQVKENGQTVEKEHHNVADAFGDVNKNMSNINNRIDDVIKKVDSDALKWNSDKKAYDATHDGTPSKIINVADGKIEKGSKDAVNGGQLWQTNERVAKVENRVTDVENHVEIIDKKVDNITNTIEDIGGIVTNINVKVDNIDNKVNDIAEDAVRYDRDENGKKTNKITLAGGDASEPVVIDNVADGKIEKGSKEAVNGGQLHDYTQEQMKIVLDESKQYTDQKINNIRIDAIDEAVDKSKQYTDMKFDALNYSIENVKKEARQAAAIGLAVSNLRYNDTPGKLSVGFGTGLWRSQSAFAFGAGYTSENGNIRSNVSVTTSGGHWGVGAGFNMTLN